MDSSSKQEIANTIQLWVENVVLKLNLCPFAHEMWNRGDWSIVVRENEDKDKIFQWTEAEIKVFLEEQRKKVEEGKGEVSTTLLVFPHSKENFIKFYNFSAMIEELVKDLGFDQEVQIVTFHPQFRFEGEKSNARGNYVNRSPYPLLHLLWAQEVTDVLEKFGENIGQKVAQENNIKLSSMTDDEFEEKVLKYVNSSWVVEKLD